MLIGGDDISNDVINLGTCFCNVCLQASIFTSDSRSRLQKHVRWDLTASKNTTTTPSRPVFPVDIIVAQR